MRILVPVPKSHPHDQDSSPLGQAPTLEGKTLGLLANPWLSFRSMIARFEELGAEEYGAKSVIMALHPWDSAQAPEEAIDKVLQADVVISGLGY